LSKRGCKNFSRQSWGSSSFPASRGLDSSLWVTVPAELALPKPSKRAGLPFASDTAEGTQRYSGSAQGSWVVSAYLLSLKFLGSSAEAGTPRCTSTIL
jgi:hypothetical protein